MKSTKSLNAFKNSIFSPFTCFQLNKPSFFLTFLLITTTFIISCKKNSLESENYKPLTPLAALAKQGYDTLNHVDLGKYYLIEGDILIEKSSSLNTTARQAINSYSQLVSLTKAPNITIRIDNSMPTDGGNLDWRSEILQAIDEYNNMFGSNVYLTLVTGSTADINIVVSNSDPSGFGTLPYYVIAAAGLPSSGNPFHQIVVNSGYAYTPVSSGQKKYNMVHEIGHCIGLRHTNWYGRGEGSAIGVGSSPNTGGNPDPNSVFNGGTAGNSWAGWTYWDVYAVGYLYPAPPSINGNLIHYSPTGAIYWGFEGNYRWIYNYETLTSLFSDSPWTLWTTSGTMPSPVGNILGALPSGQRFAFLANDLNTGKVFFVERKRVNESDVSSPLYNYCRHIYTMNVFNNYKFNFSKIENYYISFSSTPSDEAWIEGPVLYR